MKRIIPCLLLTICTLAAHAQATYLSEDFNSSCATSTGFPLDWTYYNPLPASIPSGEWACAPGDGRSGTSGISCTGVWGTPAAYHWDTGYLVSPQLNLSGYSGSIYLHFDTKTNKINLAGRLAMVVTSRDTIFDTVGGVFSDRTDMLAPLFGNDDSTEWVTHVADLTPFKSSTPLYVAFRYTSDDMSGSTWYIDNVFTTTFPAHVQQIDKSVLSLSVTGTSTSSQITLSCQTGTSGKYHLGIYDMLGREVYQEDMNLFGSEATYPIKGLNLAPGLYVIKMGNGETYGVTKTVVY